MTTYTHLSPSPLGDLLLSADDTGLTGLWFEDQKYYAAGLTSDIINTKTCSEHPIFTQTQKWLNLYFKGMEPDFTVPIHLTGTDFQKKIWALLLEIPYGETTTYGTLAKKYAQKHGLSHMSAQAVGSAIGHNKIGILVFHPLINSTFWRAMYQQLFLLIHQCHQDCISNGTQSVLHLFLQNICRYDS